MSRFSDSSTKIYAKERVGIRSIPFCWCLVGVIAVITVYYLFLLSNGTFKIFAPEMLDKVFDNMLVHLLRGEFTIDREVIDFEAATRNGKTYTYFGVFPALLRLLAIPFTDIAHAELARLSCLTAVVIFVALQLRMLLIVHASLPVGSRMPVLLVAMVAATALSGPQLYILAAARIYHEPILWSAAMAAAFNLIVLQAALGGAGLRTRDLVWLGALAGLAIHTRASVGVALYLGTTLLVAWSAWCRHMAERPQGRLPEAIAGMVRDPGILLPIVLLGVLAMAAGIVNFERWGNPLSFGDVQYSDYLHRHAELAASIRDQGLFNLNRLWVGVLYYATGIPYLLKAVPPFAAFLGARAPFIEAPPLTPLLTNPITVILAGIGLYRLWWKPELPAGSLTILRLTLIGHAAAVVLIFSAVYFTLRYRFDLAPFMTLAALVGYRSLSITLAGTSQIWRKRLRLAAIGLCVLGVLGSHYVLLVHKVCSIGVPMEVRLALLPFAPFAHAAFEQ